MADAVQQPNLAIEHEPPELQERNTWVGTRLVVSATAFLFLPFFFGYLYLASLNSSALWRPDNIKAPLGWGLGGHAGDHRQRRARRRGTSPARRRPRILVALAGARRARRGARRGRPARTRVHAARLRSRRRRLRERLRRLERAAGGRRPRRDGVARDQRGDVVPPARPLARARASPTWTRSGSTSHSSPASAPSPSSSSTCSERDRCLSRRPSSSSPS